MEISIMITFLCLLLCSALLQPCTSHQTDLHFQSSPYHQVNEVQFPIPKLPRKLRFSEVKGLEGRDFKSLNKQEEEASAKQEYKKKQVGRGNRGTMQEWVERGDTREFFTMDYSHVRRRRPVHNKSLPVGP